MYLSIYSPGYVNKYRCIQDLQISSYLTTFIFVRVNKVCVPTQIYKIDTIIFSIHWEQCLSEWWRFLMSLGKTVWERKCKQMSYVNRLSIVSVEIFCTGMVGEQRRTECKNYSECFKGQHQSLQLTNLPTKPWSREISNRTPT